MLISCTEDLYFHNLENGTVAVWISERLKYCLRFQYFGDIFFGGSGEGMETVNHDQRIICWRFGLVARLILDSLLPGTGIHSRDISSEHEGSSWFCEPGVLPHNNHIFFVRKTLLGLSL
jgi:hypothetical protein